MNVTYKRDMNHNYMIWNGQQEVDTGAYPIRMLLQNKMDGLLPCSIQYMDNQTCFYYEVTSRQPLSRACEKRKLDEEDLRALFMGILHTVELLESYLLDADNLCLEPDYLYWDWEQRTVTFCYVPGSEWDIRTGLYGLTQYLLECIDQESSEAVVFAYNLYRSAASRELNMTDIYGMIYGKNLVKQEDLIQEPVRSRRESEEEYRRHQEDLDAYFSSDEELFGRQKHSPYVVTAITVLVGLVVCLGICILLKIDLGVDLSVLGGAVLMIITLVLLLMRLISKKKKQEDQDEKRQKEIRQRDVVCFPGEEDEDDAEYVPEKEETTLLQTSVDYENAKLISMNPDKVNTILLYQPITVIGKQLQSVDVVLTQKTISRIHARIRKENGDFYLEDMNSKNGTYIDEVTAEPGQSYLLREGQQVRFADVVFTFCR